jgi:hypothetical protein
MSGDLLVKSANCYGKAAEAKFPRLHRLNRIAELFQKAGKAFRDAAQEAQKPNPNQQRIDGLIQSANLYHQSASLRQQAVEAKAAGQNRKAVYLDNAARALSDAAQEAQKPNSNPETSKQIIKWFTDSASFHQQSAEAYTAGQGEIAECLNNAGNVLCRAAWEAQKSNPNQQRIDGLIQSANLQQQSASFYQKAAENRALSDRFDMDMVQFHEGVGAAFDDDDVGTLFNDAAQAYRSSISAEKSGDASAATSWRDIGNRFRDAAKECKDFLEKNNLTPQDERFDTFLDQSTDGGPTIRQRIEEAISIRNQLRKSKP